MEGERSRPDGTVMKVQLAVVVLEILVVILMISSFRPYWRILARSCGSTDRAQRSRANISQYGIDSRASA